MKNHRLQIVFGVLFVALSLVLIQFATFYVTTRAIKLTDVRQREQECARVVEPNSRICPVCATPNIFPGRMDEPMGFPFTDYVSSMCPGSPIKDAEILDGASAFVASAAVVGGLYGVYNQLRKRGRRG